MTTSGCSLSLFNERKRFREKMALVWRVNEDPFGVPSGRISTHASLYRKMQTVSPVRHVWDSFKFRHSGNISSKHYVTVVDAWGTCGVCERCLGLRYRGMRRNTYSPVPVGKLRLYWIIWISVEPRFSHTCDDAQEANSLLFRTGSHILPLPCATSNPPSHMSTLQVSGRTPLEFGSSGQR